MNLDLLERENKYSNGFCHWPKVAWIKPDGSWQPSMANFTSLADPTAVGSGKRALTTLMHEAGHAAHFANIKQPSPLFGQEVSCVLCHRGFVARFRTTWRNYSYRRYSSNTNASPFLILIHSEPPSAQHLQKDKVCSWMH